MNDKCFHSFPVLSVAYAEVKENREECSSDGADTYVISPPRSDIWCEWDLGELELYSVSLGAKTWKEQEPPTVTRTYVSTPWWNLSTNHPDISQVGKNYHNWPGNKPVYNLFIMHTHPRIQIVPL